jgi:hypothetical protein
VGPAVLVPDNHDVDGTAVGRGVCHMQKGLLEEGSQEAIAELLQNDDERRSLLKRHAGYLDFYGTWLGQPQALPWWQRLIEIRGQRLHIAGLDSAWMACSDDDRGRLLLGRWQFSHTVTTPGAGYLDRGPALGPGGSTGLRLRARPTRRRISPRRRGAGIRLGLCPADRAFSPCREPRLGTSRPTSDGTQVAFRRLLSLTGGRGGLVREAGYPLSFADCGWMSYPFQLLFAIDTKRYMALIARLGLRFKRQKSGTFRRVSFKDA